MSQGECSAARETVRKMIPKMFVPMIQGALRYAYKVDKLQGGEVENAEGAIFAAAVLPKIYAVCEFTCASSILFWHFQLPLTSILYPCHL